MKSKIPHPPNVFDSSLECAQHAPKDLATVCRFASKIGARGIQLSNFHFNDPKREGKFLSARQVRAVLQRNGLRLDGISAHCPFWVHGTAWTQSKTIRPFIPGSVAQMPSEKITAWAENYLFGLMDLAAELEAKILPMFWGVYYGWEVATGYPWGLWSGADYDLVKEGEERFVKMSAKLRQRANQNGLYLAHEIHPGTAAMCADDFLRLREITDSDGCVVVNFDKTHCWEGEDWQTRLRKVAPWVYGAHIKDHRVKPGLPLRLANPNWTQRGMEFVPLGTGDLNMDEYADALMAAGYPTRYCKVMGTDTAPLVVEAESAARGLDWTSADGIAFVNNALRFPPATQAFDKGMGEQGRKKIPAKKAAKKK